jgi:hypothetical protein
LLSRADDDAGTSGAASTLEAFMKLHMSLLALPLLASACEGVPSEAVAPGGELVAAALTEGQDPPITAAAAGTLSILGPIRDANTLDHVPLPGVKVTLSGAASGTAITNSDGVYRFQNLAAGTYTISASRAGATFSPASRTLNLTASTVRGFDCTAGCEPGGTVVPLKELVIADRSVVTDARSSSASDGVWSFRFLMEQMAPSGTDPSDFAAHWVDGFKGTTINGFAVENRDVTQLLTLWPKKSNGKLDLAKAPFQLLAIVNRTDLHRTGDGEGRFVFGLLPADRSPRSFTVIFEFRLPTSGVSRLDWIKQFHALSALPFGSAYNSALQKITDKFVRRGTTAAGVNGSSISQVRANEIHMGGPWQLREFHLLADSSGKGALTLVQPAQTPDETRNGAAAVVTYLQSQRVDIVGGFASVPLALIGGQSNEQVPWAFPGASPPVPEATRKTFAGQTCNGCHNGETLTKDGRQGQLDGFYQVRPADPSMETDGQERLSDFIKQAELPRRARFVQNRLTCAADLSDCAPGSEPMVHPEFVAAGP